LKNVKKIKKAVTVAKLCEVFAGGSVANGNHPLVGSVIGDGDEEEKGRVDVTSKEAPNSPGGVIQKREIPTPTPPQKPTLRFFPSATASDSFSSREDDGAGSVAHTIAPPVTLECIALSKLLEYQLVEESAESFEVHLMGEFLWELLVREASHVIASAIHCGVGSDGDIAHGKPELKAEDAAKKSETIFLEKESDTVLSASEKVNSAAFHGVTEEALATESNSIPEGPLHAPPQATLFSDFERACRLFDREGAGHMGLKELESVMRNGAHRFSVQTVKSLVSIAGAGGGKVQSEIKSKKLFLWREMFSKRVDAAF